MNVGSVVVVALGMVALVIAGAIYVILAADPGEGPDDSASDPPSVHAQPGESCRVRHLRQPRSCSSSTREKETS